MLIFNNNNKLNSSSNKFFHNNKMIHNCNLIQLLKNNLYN